MYKTFQVAFFSTNPTFIFGQPNTGHQMYKTQTLPTAIHKRRFKCYLLRPEPKCESWWEQISVPHVRYISFNVSKNLLQGRVMLAKSSLSLFLALFGCGLVAKELKELATHVNKRMHQKNPVKRMCQVAAVVVLFLRHIQSGHGNM